TCLDPSATAANRFFERRSRRTIRTCGSPNTPRTVALARKPANEYPSDRRRCRFPDSAIAQRAKIERPSKLKKASIHRLFRRYDPSKSPTRFPEDPEKLTRSAATLERRSLRDVRRALNLGVVNLVVGWEMLFTRALH